MSRFTIFIAGDTMARTSEESGNPFEYVAGIRGECDAAFCNLETVLTEQRERAPHSQIHICTPPKNLGHLTGAEGFDAVSLANNHTLDYGAAGVGDTIASLDGAGIAHTGAGLSREESLGPALIEVKGAKIAFIGMALTGSMAGPETFVPSLDLEDARRAIAMARQAGASIVICSPHWGAESAYFPSPEQQAFGRALIDAGADIVVGHHPHVVQGVEIYRGKYIFYSLGNFNFFQSSAKNQWRFGAALKLEFENGSVSSYDMLPIRINDNYQPVPLDAEKRERFREWLDELSSPLAAGISWQWWMRRVGRATYRRRLSGWVQSIALAKGLTQKLKMLGRFAAWLFAPGSLRWAFAVLKSFLFHPRQRYAPPEEFSR
ncbi:MAG: CapA family protein [Planctomycetota bacterium]